MRVLLLLILAVSNLAIAAAARADIGFPAAVSICRKLAPAQKLVAIRVRQRNGVWVYEGDLVNAPPAQTTTATIDRDTGALIDLAVAATPAGVYPMLVQVLQRLHYAGVDFAQAIALAGASSGLTATERVDLLYEAGVLAFRVRFSSGVTVGIDSVTGGVIPAVVPGLGIEATVSAAEMAGAIAHAQWVAGSNWRVLEARAFQRFDGVTVRMLLAHRLTGQLMRPEIVQGFYIPSTPFTPQGSQIARAAAMFAGSPVTGGAMDALAAVQSLAPGLGVNGVSLEVRAQLGGTSHEWVVSFVDAGQVERDARYDATLPLPPAPAVVAPFDLAAADVNRDTVVDARDLAELLAAWGVFNPLLDLNDTGLVDGGDLAVVLGGWAQ